MPLNNSIVIDTGRKVNFFFILGNMSCSGMHIPMATNQVTAARVQE